MGKIFAYHNNATIEESAWNQFDCAPVPQSKKHRRDKNERKRKQVSGTVQKFIEVMSGPTPPQTEDEAVRMVVPIVTMLLSYLFQQLTIMVVKWLWEQANKPAACLRHEASEQA